MEFFWQWANIVDTLASQRTEAAGSVRLQVDSPTFMQIDSPTWSDESSLLFVVHVLHLILFVEKYTCGGPRGVRRLLTDLQSASSPVFFFIIIFTAGLVVYT